MESKADKLRAELAHYRALAERTSDRRFRQSIKELIAECEARLRNLEGWRDEAPPSC